jgi:hypothetical protein
VNYLKLAAVLLVGVVMIVCNVISVVLSWAAWPFDQLRLLGRSALEVLTDRGR